jgi:tetratricopeptide (TPR) repeat protein
MIGADALLATLQALLREGRYPDALAAYDAARASGVPVGERPDLALVVATAATRTGDVERGRVEAAAALTRFAARGDDDGVMRCQNLLGAVAFERGELEEARVCFDRAQHLADRLGDGLMAARTANNLASITHLLGNPGAARGLYREALLAYQRLGSQRGTAETYHNLALVARDEGDLEEAQVAGDHAIRHANQVDDAGLTALVLTGRSETAVLAGEVTMAEESLERAEELVGRAGDEAGQAEIERVRSLRWWHSGDLARALEAAGRGRRSAARLGIALLEGECAALEARALAALGREAEAARRNEQARRLFRALGAEGHLRRLQEGRPS